MLKKSNILTDDAKMIRQEVFVEEQGFFAEFDEIDSRATHLVLYENDVPAAVCRYYKGEKPGEYVIGRLAIRKCFRGKQLGKYMVEAAEQEIKKEGAECIKLSAQVRVQRFYEKCGFKAVGERYFDEQCPHICMVKQLKQGLNGCH